MAVRSPSTNMSFSEYTFDLSERLRQAAHSTLSELEASINRDGYDWLDDYFDNIQAAGHRAPIADLIKTPSRTATSKKTRAATTATVNRAEQIRAFNARMALSPLADKSPAGRRLFSPLQEQSVNSPQRLGLSQALSPTKSPLAGKLPVLELKPKKSDAQSKAKAEPKSTRSKGKGKAKADAENVNENDKPAPKKRGRPKKNAALDDSTTSKDSTTTISRSVRSAAPKSPSPEPVPQVVEPQPEPETELELESEQVEESAQLVPTVEATNEPIVVDEHPAEIDNERLAEEKHESDGEAYEEPAEEPTLIHEPAAEEHPAEKEPMEVDVVLSVPVEAAAPEEPFEVESEDEVAPDADTDVEVSDDDEPIPSPRKAAPVSPSPVKKAASPVKQLSPVKSLKYSSPVQATTPAKASSPLNESSPVKQAAEPSAKSSSPIKAVEGPAAKVRSSWLTQALGDRPFPVHNARTSTVGGPPASNRLTASLKRKSEDGPGADVDDKFDAKRAEKIARFDSQAIDAATGRPASPQRSAIFASRQPGSSTSLPSVANVATPSASAARNNPTSVPNDGRGKHNKVHSALEELRERTAAAAAAKQKSAAASKLANATKTPIQPATSSGFLRGLGNLGAGLLAFGGYTASPSVEDEGDRLRREAEEREAQEKAEAELARIMGEMRDEDRQPARSPSVRVVGSKFTKNMLPSEGDSSQMGDVAIVVDEDDEMADDESDEDDERNASITLPELPTPDIGDEFDEEPLEDGPASALGAAGIHFKFDTTTPPHTPPLKIRKVSKMQTPEIIVSPPPKETSKTRAKSALGTSVRTASRPQSKMDYYDDDEDMDEDDDDDYYEKSSQYSSKKAPAKGSRTVSGSGSTSRLSKSSTLSQAERIAAKALGVKSAAGPVKSLQRAAEAAKKEESAAERKAALRANIERRKQEEARRKEEADRQAAEEERKRKATEQEERRKRLAEAERRRKELAAEAARAKAAREEREAAEAAEAARIKAAEEEAARKRKAALLNKSQQGNSSIKRIAQPAAKAPIRLSKSTVNLASSTATVGRASSSKGPNTFRTNEEHHTSTIKLVSSNASRPIAQVHATSSHYTSAQTLQQKRQTLQSQLDQKVVEVESEEIVLPDIASEYSDSDDSDKETDFVRPAWAESPELHKALAQQASLNPDELFGSIRPLNMDELFKQRQGKFRARTSSANWSGADRLTEAEEREYARRMGFKPLNVPRDGGHTAGER